MMECENCGCSDGWVYDAAKLNEEGWLCVNCDHRPGEPPGFCPQLDVEETQTKVRSILYDLDAAGLLCPSNSSLGESLVYSVAKRCSLSCHFDARSIIHYLTDDDDHAAYWLKIREGVLTGNDQRRRCYCGQLATVSTGGKHFCRTHMKLA